MHHSVCTLSVLFRRTAVGILKLLIELCLIGPAALFGNPGNGQFLVLQHQFRPLQTVEGNDFLKGIAGNLFQDPGKIIRIDSNGENLG